MDDLALERYFDDSIANVSKKECYFHFRNDAKVKLSTSMLVLNLNRRET